MKWQDALIDWDEPVDESSNTAHIAEHGLMPEDVESALSTNAPLSIYEVPEPRE